MTQPNPDFQNNPLPAEPNSGIAILPPSPPGGVWGFWATFGLGAAIAAVWVTCQIIITMIFVLTKVISKPGGDILDLLMEIPTDGGFISLVTIVSSIIGLALIVIFIVIKRNANLADYLALKKISVNSILFAIGMVLLLVALEIVVSFGSNDTQFTNYLLEAYKSSPNPVFLWIAVVFVGPVFEEAFFRGFLYTGLAQSKLRVPGAIILTALFWSAMHASQYGIFSLIFIFAVGIALGILRWRTKSIWNCLLMHCLFNAAAMIQLALLTR